MEIHEIREKNRVLEEAVWVTDIPNFKDASLLVKPLSSPQAMKTHAQMTRLAQVNENFNEDDVDREFLLTMLCGWKEITQNNEPVEFSTEKAKEFLEMDLFAIGVRYATIAAARKVDDILKEMEKNSSGPLSGKSGTARPTSKRSKSRSAAK